jgi:hypothetical protein
MGKGPGERRKIGQGRSHPKKAHTVSRRAEEDRRCAEGERRKGEGEENSVRLDVFARCRDALLESMETICIQLKRRLQSTYCSLENSPREIDDRVLRRNFEELGVGLFPPELLNPDCVRLAKGGSDYKCN